MAVLAVGEMWLHSALSLVTEMKSEPRKTPSTPGTSNSAAASGEILADSEVRKSRGSPTSTSRPGRNFRVAGFGVAAGIALFLDHATNDYRIDVVVERAELDDRGMVCDLDVLEAALHAAVPKLLKW